MELILVDSSIDLDYDNTRCGCATLYISLGEKLAEGDADIQQGQLFNRVDNWSPTTIELSVHFMGVVKNQGINIILSTNPSHPRNIFESLWNRFHSDVELFVYVKYALSADDEWTDFVTFKRLMLRQKRFNVLGTTAYNSSGPAYNTEFVRLHVKIVAHFPTAPIINITPRENLPNRNILEEGLFSDLTIVAANGAEIKAHKSFLSAQSPVLMANFKTGMQESQTGRLDMSDVSEVGIWAFLRYLYYGDLEGPIADIGVAFNVLYAAHKYHVSSLEADAIKCLMKRKSGDFFNVGIAFKIYMFARNVESMVGLKAKIVRILKTKLNELELVKEFQELFQKKSNPKVALEVFKDFAKLSSSEEYERID